MTSPVIVTGGAGYIGSQTCLVLLRAGHAVTVFDNLSNSSPRSLDLVRQLAGPDAPDLTLERVDLRDTGPLAAAIGRAVDRGSRAVVHFAGLKAVAESVERPLDYYENNFLGSVNLVRVMEEHGLRRLIFSSSCTVYGNPGRLPISEEEPRKAVNPYGRTKLFVEEMLEDLVRSFTEWKVWLLRYFNPVGADPSGLIGEDPKGPPNNLMPNVMRVAVGHEPFVKVFGDDYDTPDGSCIRDYVHVADLAEGHLSALAALDDVDGCRAVNLGTGRGHSVLEVIAAVSHAVGREIPYRVEARRPGDVSCLYSDTTLAGRALGWEAKRDLDDMCRDTWKWQKEHPHGYQPA